MIGHGIGVHGHEEGGGFALGDGDALFEGDENVPGAGEFHPVAATGEELALKFAGGGKGNVLFEGAGEADGAGVLAAVARVKHDKGQSDGWLCLGGVLPGFRPGRCG